MPPGLPLTLSCPDLLVDGRDDAFRSMVADMLHVSTLLRNARDELAQAVGVSAPQYAIVMAVARWEAPGGPSVSDIAAILRVSVPFIVAQNRFLVAASLLDKKPDPTDGRRVRLALTPTACKALLKLAPLQCRINDTLFATITATEFHALRHTMRKLATLGE